MMKKKLRNRHDKTQPVPMRGRLNKKRRKNKHLWLFDVGNMKVVFNEESTPDSNSNWRNWKNWHLATYMVQMLSQNT